MCLNLMISKYPGVNLNEFCHSAETSNKPTAIKPIFMSAHDESTNTGTSVSSHPLGTGTKTNSKKTTVYTTDHLWESTGTWECTGILVSINPMARREKAGPNA